MFFNAISTFQFKTETVQTHALNIKKLSEWISIPECHLGLSQCRELTAIAFGFKTAQDLKEFLGELELSKLTISSTIEADLAQAIQKFCNPIPFMSLSDKDIPVDFLSSFSALACPEDVQEDSSLVKCQKFWADWHLKFAKFLTKYFKETHGKFDWFNRLELIDLNCTNQNKLVLCYGDEPEYTFLNLAIFNHLYTQYAGDYGNYIIGLNDHKIFDHNVQDRIYILSAELLTYIQEHWDTIAFLKQNIFDINQPHVLAYDAETKQAKLNLMLCKSYLVLNYYCPTNYKGFNYGIQEGVYKSFLFNTNSYEKPFSFTIPYDDNVNFMNQLQLYQGLQITEDDFVAAELHKSFAIQKILEHDKSAHITNGNFSEHIFDLPWQKKMLFDVTDNSFKINETFSCDYLFRKSLARPLLHDLDGRLERLEPFLEVQIGCRVYATLEVTIKDSKISIELSNIKTKLSKFGYNTPVSIVFYTKNVDTGQIYTYKDERMEYTVSALKNRNSFKKMLDAHVFIGPYKQYFLKHLVADIYRTHQHTRLQSLSDSRNQD